MGLVSETVLVIRGESFDGNARLNNIEKKIATRQIIPTPQAAKRELLGCFLADVGALGFPQLVQYFDEGAFGDPQYRQYMKLCVELSLEVPT